MQYHLNGYRAGDPSVSKPVESATEVVDVLIVGSGSAGVTLAAQLSAFGNISTRIVEQKPGPLEVGQADGVACRSVEMFEAFGFAEKVIKEGYQISEVAFWRPAKETAGLVRSDRIQDVEDDLSEMPHLVLNQARVHDFFLERMRSSPTRLKPEYNRQLVSLNRPADPEKPIEAMIKHLDREGELETIKAKFVVGCDGARSAVRKAIGIDLKGKSARQLWGVMDILAITDFPDIRLKAAIQSADHGSLLIIPREGGYMARLYIELDELHGDERAADRNVTSEMLIEKASRVLSPYTLDVKQIAWWSAYEIGQRVCDVFDDRANHAPPRIFIAGDACHTHSPKAGQGMNVSMADAFNLGWKLAAVVKGQAMPGLLETYSDERQAKAKELIEFDRDMARLFSAKPTNAAEAAQFQHYFQKHGRYTAGVEARYDPSLIVGDGAHQHLANGYTVGMRFHSAPVIRLGDAKPTELGHALKADGRWRLIAFAAENDNGLSDGGIGRLCAFLGADDDSLLRRFTPAGADIDSVLDLRAAFQTSHRDMRVDLLPSLLLPRKGKFGLVDYEKVFCPDPIPGRDIFDMRGIDRSAGALLIVRPDQFVASVLPLDAYSEIGSLFDQLMIAP